MMENRCNCFRCREGEQVTRMVRCPACGNKRCPKAIDHRLDCTNSNASGQPGSGFPEVPRG